MIQEIIQEIIDSVSHKYDMHWSQYKYGTLVMLKKVELMSHISVT